LFESLQARAVMQYKWFVVHFPLIGLEPEIVKYDLVARKANGTRCVVFCGPKDHGAAEVAHRSRLQDLSVHFYLEKAHPSRGQTKSKVCLDIV